MNNAARRRPAHLAAAAVLALAAAVSSGCGEPADAEQQIASSLDRMTEALEAGEVGRFMDFVADDFSTGDGRLNRDTLAFLVRRERLTRSSIRVQRLGTDITVFEGGRAGAEFQALALGGSGWLPDEGEWWRVETGWRLDGGEWMLISADWARGAEPAH